MISFFSPSHSPSLALRGIHSFIFSFFSSIFLYIVFVCVRTRSPCVRVYREHRNKRNKNKDQQKRSERDKSEMNGKKKKRKWQKGPLQKVISLLYRHRRNQYRFDADAKEASRVPHALITHFILRPSIRAASSIARCVLFFARRKQFARIHCHNAHGIKGTAEWRGTQINVVSVYSDSLELGE